MRSAAYFGLAAVAAIGGGLGIASLTKADPREELVALGMKYTYEDFKKAFREGDTKAVKLFTDAGMKVKDYSLFYDIEFNSDASKVVIAADAFDRSALDVSGRGIAICSIPLEVDLTHTTDNHGTPITYINNMHDYKFLADDEVTVHDASRLNDIRAFKRAACNTPEMLAKIDRLITAGRGIAATVYTDNYINTINIEYLQGWEAARAFLATGKPSGEKTGIATVNETAATPKGADAQVIREGTGPNSTADSPAGAAQSLCANVGQNFSFNDEKMNGDLAKQVDAGCRNKNK